MFEVVYSSSSSRLYFGSFTVCGLVAAGTCVSFCICFCFRCGGLLLCGRWYVPVLMSVGITELIAQSERDNAYMESTNRL